MYSIVADQLTKQFGTFTAVDHISFQVKRGEIFGFLGANGAGKSTIMKSIIGLAARNICSISSSHPSPSKKVSGIACQAQ